jgi:hypothetical protein
MIFVSTIEVDIISTDQKLMCPSQFQYLIASLHIVKQGNGD